MTPTATVPWGWCQPGSARSRGFAAQLPGASILQSGRAIKEFDYDRSIRQGQPVRADVRLYPEDNLLPTFTFDLRPLEKLAGHDLTVPTRTRVHGEVLVSDAVGGTWLEWFQRAAIPLLRHLALKAKEEVEVHGLREAHVADHFYPEGIIVGASPAHDYRPGTPVSLVVFGGRPMLGHLPILDLDAHEALYRSFFEGVEALQANHPVTLCFKPRGLSGEHEDWLYQVVGRTADWEPVYEHSLRLELPNMVYASVSMGTSALVEGLSRGIPGLIVREFPVRDYTTLDAETFPILPATPAAELITTCCTEAGYRSLAQEELSHYRDELGL